MFTFAAHLALSTAWANEMPQTLELYPEDAPDKCDRNAMQVRVKVIGVTEIGIMKLELYNSDEGFLNKSGRLRSVRVAAKNGPQLLCMNLHEPGTYAVAGYHDRDGDRKFDKRWDFVPKEPYGLSNNPEIKKRRLPKFEEAAFDVGFPGIDIDFILVDLLADKKQEDAQD